jgi:NitT/TauT family transport system substrate-binding protein
MEDWTVSAGPFCPNREVQRIAVTRRQFLQSLKLGGLTGLIAPFAGCSPRGEAPLRIGAIPWPGYECLFLARALGLWANHSFKLVDYPTSPEAVRAFRNGALEAVAVTSDEFLRLAAEEPSARAMLVMDFSHGADAVIAQPGYEQLRKLEGKRVGVEVNATGVFVLTRALDTVGLTRRDIEIVPLDNDQHEAAFKSGKVDAVVTFEPNRTRILRLGGRVLFDSSHIPGEVADLLVVRAEVLERRMAGFRALLGTWFAARNHLLNNTPEAASLIAPHQNISAGEFIQTLKLITLPSQEENKRLLGLPDSALIQGLVRTHRIMHDRGHFKVAPATAGLMDARALS